MIAWRLCRRPYADLTGEGARRYGGRWNSVGKAVVYLAEHPALAALEVRVHLDLPFDLLPADYVLLHVEVPDSPAIICEALTDSVASGDAWLTEAKTAVFRARSALAPHSWNILLNPVHPDAAGALVQAIEPFNFDPRLWRPLAGEA